MRPRKIREGAASPEMVLVETVLANGNVSNRFLVMMGGLGVEPLKAEEPGSGMWTVLS